MVYRIKEYKPALKQGGSPVDVSEHKPALAYDTNSDIVMFAEESWLSISINWLKSGLLFLASALLIFTVLYGTLAASIVFITPVDGQLNVVARGTFLGGIPSNGDIVLASATQKAGVSPIDRLKEAALGIEGAKVVKVLSGSTDAVTTNDGTITVAGQSNATYTGQLLDSEGKVVNANNKRLDNQFLALCVAGDCQKDTYVIVDSDKIFGEVTNVEGVK